MRILFSPRSYFDGSICFVYEYDNGSVDMRYRGGEWMKNLPSSDIEYMKTLGFKEITKEKYEELTFIERI